MITKQKPFNKSQIGADTQKILMDETYAKLMDPDNWKVVYINLTGFLALGNSFSNSPAHDRKYKSSFPLTIRYPMFITCREEMNVEEEHNAAMNLRLRKFHFKTLRSAPVAGAVKFLKEHAVDCIVWASDMAVTSVDELPPPVLVI